MTFGTKEGTYTHNENTVKVKYYCHVVLEAIPNMVKELNADMLQVEKITFDEDNGLWRIDYFEIVEK